MIKRKAKGLCLGLAIMSIISIFPVIANASELDLLHGWRYRKDSWYHYNLGHLETGWINENGDWYFTYSDGKMVTGWAKTDGHWYYFYDNGSMAKDTTVDGHYIDSNGICN